MPKLTKRTVQAARPRKEEGYHILWDDDLKGFGLVVTSTGVKTYVVQYRTLPGRAGRSRRFKLGRHTELTARQAREMAENALADVRRGKDPARERRERLNAPTMEDLVELFVERHVIPKCKASTARITQGLLKNHILPAFGRRKVAGLTTSDVQEVHRSMQKTPAAANRVVEVLQTMLNLAEQWGIRPMHSNPCTHVKRYRRVSRERFLSRGELARVGQALDDDEAQGRSSSVAHLALRLILLTGARKMEILKLKWSEVDFERRCLRLEDSKTGPKVIVLNTPALELLEAAPRIEDNPYVCPGTKKGRHFVGLQGVWERVRTRAGIEDVRIHDLRHSFASVGAGGGLSLPLIGGLLGHRCTQTTARYAHLANDPLQKATEQIGRDIATQLLGTKPKDSKGRGDEPSSEESGGEGFIPQGMEGFLSLDLS